MSKARLLIILRRLDESLEDLIAIGHDLRLSDLMLIP